MRRPFALVALVLVLSAPAAAQLVPGARPSGGFLGTGSFAPRPGTAVVAPDGTALVAADLCDELGITAVAGSSTEGSLDLAPAAGLGASDPAVEIPADVQRRFLAPGNAVFLNGVAKSGPISASPAGIVFDGQTLTEAEEDLIQSACRERLD